MISNKQLGQVGETAVALELLKKGFDVININCTYTNYQKADLICMNPTNGNCVMVQVKTGTTKNILTGFVSELNGTIPYIEESIIGPWVFVKTDKDDLSKFEFYILTREEIIELITTSNKWYVTEWNRKLQKKPIVGVDISWLKGEGIKATESHMKIQHGEYKNPLGHNSLNRWDKIEKLLADKK
ncbi:MAG: hypothetical protein J6C15_05690 [Bacteroidaceae bacterium]|nr:hypothetical protein [Bacteroidaceae bacterium]